MPHTGACVSIKADFKAIDGDWEFLWVIIPKMIFLLFIAFFEKNNYICTGSGKGSAVMSNHNN